MAVRSLPYLVSVLGLASCTIGAPELGAVEQALRCDPDFCGTNSPLMRLYGAWEYNTTGVPNAAGFTVLGLGKGTDLYSLEVSDSRLIAKDRWGTPVLTGEKLVGARIYLERRGRQFAISISDVGHIQEVVAPHSWLETYVLDFAAVDSGTVTVSGDAMESEPTLGPSYAVCPPPKWLDEPYVGAMVEWDETVFTGMEAYHSLVFEGDRFDPEARTVARTADNSYFNIGCGAHTLAKLRLTRNTINTAPDWTNVQAALKMLGGDYCGNGTPFTFPGEPLVWRDRTAMDYLHLGANHDLEARWNENGAICVGGPRLIRSANPAVAATYADVWQAIEDECTAVGKALPKCSDPNPLAWESTDELVTSVNYD